MRVTLLVDSRFAQYVPVLSIFPHTDEVGEDGDLYIAQAKYVGSIPEGKRAHIWPDGYAFVGKRKKPDKFYDFTDIKIEKPQLYYDWEVIEWDTPIPRGELVALDTETVSLDDRTLLGVSVSRAPNQATYYVGTPEQVKEFARRYSEQNEGIWHNAKFDLINIGVKECSHDTIIEAWLTGRVPGTLSLERLTESVVRGRHLTFEDLGYGGKQFDGRRIPVRDMARKSCGDADDTRRIHGVLFEDLQRLDLLPLYNTIEMKLPSILATMTEYGVRVDHVERMNQINLTKNNMISLDAQLKHMGYDFNRRSDEQLADHLYKKLKLPIVKAVKGSGNPSVDKHALAALEGYEDAIPLLLLEREYHKKLEFLANEADEIHANFNQTSVVTGRLSSSNPNMQQMPPHARKIVVPREGMVFVGADYSQVEMRIAAFLSQDPTLMKAFANGEDVHEATAMICFGKKDKKSRGIAKTVNFAILYGAEMDKIVEVTGSRDSAETVLNNHRTQLSKLWEWAEETVEGMYENGYVRSMAPSRRIRLLPNPYGRYTDPRSLEREAVNTVIQATSADITKSAMIELDGLAGLYDAHLILQIHDELIYEVPVEVADEWQKVMERVMANTFFKPDGLHLVVEGKSASRWSDLK